jgi:hypothetical protein
MLNRKATAIVGVLLCASLMFVASPAISQSFYGLFVSVVRDAQGRFTRNAPFDRGLGQALSPAFSGFDQEQSDNSLQLALGNAHSFTPTTINELNIGFVQFRRERRSVDTFTRNWIQELGISCAFRLASRVRIGAFRPRCSATRRRALLSYRQIV